MTPDLKPDAWMHVSKDGYRLTKLNRLDPRYRANFKTFALYAADNPALKALVEKGEALAKFYACIWDRTDGCIVLFPDKVDAFEKAHSEFTNALAPFAEHSSGKEGV